MANRVDHLLFANILKSLGFQDNVYFVASPNTATVAFTLITLNSLFNLIILFALYFFVFKSFCCKRTKQLSDASTQTHRLLPPVSASPSAPRYENIEYVRNSRPKRPRFDATGGVVRCDRRVSESAGVADGNKQCNILTGHVQNVADETSGFLQPVQRERVPAYASVHRTRNWSPRSPTVPAYASTIAEPYPDFSVTGSTTWDGSSVGSRSSGNAGKSARTDDSCELREMGAVGGTAENSHAQNGGDF